MGGRPWVVCGMQGFFSRIRGLTLFHPAAPDGSLTVEFVAHERPRAGAVYGVRQLRVDDSGVQ